MRRRIQRKPIRPIRGTVNEQSTAKGLNIQGVITVLGGITGIIVALLWIAGRFYVAGYFGAMNIPASQINFSVWEYAEAAWLKLIFYFFRRIFPGVIVLSILPVTIVITAFILGRIFPRMKLMEAVSRIVVAISRLRTGLSYVFAFGIVSIFAYVFLETLIDINETAQREGRKAVLSYSYSVQVYSKDYLPMGMPNVNTASSPTLLEYSGLRLLTFNNGKYYLFRDIDPITCKPSQVFIIPDSANIIIILNAITPITTPCATTTK